MTSDITEDLRTAYQALEGAETREDVARIYGGLSGHDIPDDGDMETLAGFVTDYIGECCFEYGIHWLDVVEPCATDDERSNGPRR